MKQNLQSGLLPEQYFFRQKIQLSGPKGQPLEIPIGGAIGLLALGDLGIIAWRQKIQQIKMGLAQRTQQNLGAGQETNALTTNKKGHEEN